MADRVQKAYAGTSGIYDGLLTGSSLIGRLYIGMFWGGIDVSDISGRLLERIPEGFSGSILDVPAGTAVFTCGKWASLPDAEITCLDYSREMIARAGERLSGLPNVRCVQGDVGDLPMEDGSFDIVLSMNGFHAFPDKDAAFSEIHRVLRPGGRLIACFYVDGESRVTDWLVRNVLSRKGWFTPPFQTSGELLAMLETVYGDVDLHTEGSIAYFTAVKR